MRSTAEVATAIELLGDTVEQMGFSVQVLKTLRAIKQCRTAALGGHIDRCNTCSTQRISYNSCRNRHCPKCQGHKREEWIQKRENELLPTPYYHVVFTLPSELNSLCIYQARQVYDCLFAAAWQTIEKFSAQKKLRMGMISILHTWGQNLSLHPHLHCIIPGAGVNAAGHLQSANASHKFLYSVKAMSKIYRAKFVANMRKKKIGTQELYNTLFKKEWVVFAKRPFGSPTSVIEYLGRYTHKVAISNSRIKNVNSKEISFYYKDYKQQGTKKEMSMNLKEFVRRFAQHILPSRYVRIRHYGILSSTWKRKKFHQLRKNLHTKKIPKPIHTMLRKCPCCKTGTMITIEIFGKRGPPAHYLLTTKQPSHKS